MTVIDDIHRGAVFSGDLHGKAARIRVAVGIGNIGDTGEVRKPHGGRKRAALENRRFAEQARLFGRRETAGQDYALRMDGAVARAAQTSPERDATAVRFPMRRKIPLTSRTWTSRYSRLIGEKLRLT